MRYVVPGATGQTGTAVADRLLADGATVRLAVRNPAKADHWAARGCEVVQADVKDAGALAAAFAGADGVYLMNPPNYKAVDLVEDARHVAEAFALALRQSGIFRREPDGWRTVHRHADSQMTRQGPREEKSEPSIKALKLTRPGFARSLAARLKKVRDDHLSLSSVERVALAKRTAEQCLFRAGAPRESRDDPDQHDQTGEPAAEGERLAQS
jgi:NAD(P)H-binding